MRARITLIVSALVFLCFIVAVILKSQANLADEQARRALLAADHDAVAP